MQRETERQKTILLQRASELWLQKWKSMLREANPTHQRSWQRSFSSFHLDYLPLLHLSWRRRWYLSRPGLAPFRQCLWGSRRFRLCGRCVCCCRMFNRRARKKTISITFGEVQKGDLVKWKTTYTWYGDIFLAPLLRVSFTVSSTMLAMNSSSAFAVSPKTRQTIRSVCCNNILQSLWKGKLRSRGKLTNENRCSLGNFANVFIGLHDLLDSCYGELALCGALDHLV